MTTLHIFNKPPSDIASLQDCLRCLQEGDGLIFIEDGVYTALNPSLESLPSHVSLYSLAPDVAARGLPERLSKEIELVDDASFVRLCCQFDKSISWF